MRVAVFSNALLDPQPCGTKTMLVELIKRWATTHADRIQLSIVVQSDEQRKHLNELLPAGNWKPKQVAFELRPALMRWLSGFGGSLTRYIGQHDIYLSGWHWPLGKLDRPFVGIVHDLIPLTEPREVDNSLKRNVYRFLYRRSLHACCHRAAALVSVSQSTLNDLHAIRPKRIPPTTVIPHGIDVDWWQQRSPDEEHVLRRHRLTDSQYVLGIGRHVPNKNFRELVSAIGAAPSDVKLVLAGGHGTETESLRSIIAANGLDDRVIMTGFVLPDELRTLMQHAAVFALPSLNEGFGIPVLEAFAAGTAVVCTNTASLREVAGDAAILIEPQSSAGFGPAIRKIVGDVAVRESMIARGRARAHRFSWDVAAAEYVQLFDRLKCQTG